MNEQPQAIVSRLKRSLLYKHSKTAVYNQLFGTADTQFMPVVCVSTITHSHCYKMIN